MSQAIVIEEVTGAQCRAVATPEGRRARASRDRAGDQAGKSSPDLGIRIEDEVRVTREGHEDLTAAAPKAPEEVELCCTR